MNYKKYDTLAQLIYKIVRFVMYAKKYLIKKYMMKKIKYVFR
jgi:hypothetical protein